MVPGSPCWGCAENSDENHRACGNGSLAIDASHSFEAANDGTANLRTRSAYYRLHPANRRAAAQSWWRGYCLVGLAVTTLAGCATNKQRDTQSPFVAGTIPPAQTASPQPPTVRTVAYESAEAPSANDAPQLPAPLPPSGNSSKPLGEQLSMPEVVPTPRETVTAPGAITLSEAMSETLQSDPKLRGAMEAIRQAEGDFKTSTLSPNPSVQINGLFLPVRPFTPDRPGGPPELDVIGSWPIDWWLFGKRAAAMANAQIGVAVSNADYCDQVRQRLANTASAYYDILEARAMLQLAQEDLANSKRVERITAEGVKFGGTGTIEAERARLDVLAAQTEERTRATTLKTAKAQFRAAIGRPAQMSATDAAGNLEIGKPAPPLSLSEAISLAERNRPDIISLRQQVAKARSAIEVEQTKARAQITPSLGYQYQWQESQGIPDAASYTAQMGVTVPLFDRNQGNIAKAQSVLAQSCYNLQAQLVQTEADVEQAVGEFQAAEENATAIGPAQLAAARSVRDRTLAAYSLGGKTLLDVLDAERAYRDTHRTYILSQSAYWHSLYRLNAAVGQQVMQ
jgi:cobalt-zinc-cadmium efflux system outer membrane protein